MTEQTMTKQTKTAFVDVENSRLLDQTLVMQKIADAQHCPFCPDQLKKYHKEPVIIEGKHWLVTKNQWPYENTRVHLLFILKYHAERFEELEPEVGGELFELVAKMCTQYEVPGGAVAMRFGDTDYSAGSVAHLHVQFVVPEITAPDFKPVRIKIGKDIPYTT